MRQRGFSAWDIQTGALLALWANFIQNSYQIVSDILQSPFSLFPIILQTRVPTVGEAGGHGLGADEAVANSGTLFRGREAEVETEDDRYFP